MTNTLPQLEITFLGTGTSVGVPMVGCHCEVCQSTNAKDNRLRSSVYIKSSDTKLLIDTGPDLRQQLLRAKIDSIDAVLITHFHKDHIGGLDDLRALTIGNSKTINIFSSREVERTIRREIPYAFGTSSYPTAPRLKLSTISKENSFHINKLMIQPIEVLHGDLKILGFRINNFTYITDCSHIEQEEKEKIEGSTHFVINGIRWKKHPSHFTINQSIELAQKLNVEKTYITHISHQLGKHDVVQKKMPINIFLAYDQMQLKS